MADITPLQPGDARRMAIHARQVLTTCDACHGAVHRSNVTRHKDGRRLCPVCVDSILDALFADRKES